MLREGGRKVEGERKLLLDLNFLKIGLKMSSTTRYFSKAPDGGSVPKRVYCEQLQCFPWAFSRLDLFC